MNRLATLFRQKQAGILSVYFCAGHPHPDSTLSVLRALQQGGVDLVEVGIPFSDPLADGPTIQAASAAALRQGMSLRRLFGQLRGMRSEIRLPVILMGYLNPILAYGFDEFCRTCAEVGVDAVIIPDLPFERFLIEFREMADRYGLEVIFLITPETPAERIRAIDAYAHSFIYAVSSAATTGAQRSFDEQKQAYFARLQAMQLRHPFLIGFGISNRATREAADAYSAGVIVGSKFVSLLEQSAHPAEAVEALHRSLAT